MASAEFTDFFFLKRCCHFVQYQQFTTGFSIGYCWWHYWDWSLFKKQHHHINIFVCRLLPRDECTSINRVYVIETNKILKVKCSLNKFFFIDQDTYWTQPNGCLNSDMFYLDKLHLVEKENAVLAKSTCRSMEYSHRIITRLGMSLTLKDPFISKSCTEGLHKTFKAFIKPFEAPQRSMKIKI